MRNPAVGGLGSRSMRHTDLEPCSPNESYAQPVQPAWVPELIVLLIEFYRKRSPRFAWSGRFAWERPCGEYPPDQAA